MAYKNELMKLNSSDISLLLHSEYAEPVSMPFGRLIFLASVDVAGFKYTEDIDTIVAELEVGDVMTFIREPDNKFDKKAIAIYDPSGNKIGYVHMQDGEVISHLMDAGKSIFGVLSRLDYNEEILSKYFDKTFTTEEIADPKNRYFWPWNMLQINVFMED